RAFSRPPRLLAAVGSLASLELAAPKFFVAIEAATLVFVVCHESLPPFWIRTRTKLQHVCRHDTPRVVKKWMTCRAWSKQTRLLRRGAGAAVRGPGSGLLRRSCEAAAARRRFPS